MTRAAHPAEHSFPVCRRVRDYRPPSRVPWRSALRYMLGVQALDAQRPPPSTLAPLPLGSGTMAAFVTGLPPGSEASGQPHSTGSTCAPQPRGRVGEPGGLSECSACPPGQTTWGLTGALGLVLVSPTLSPLDPECGVAFPSSNPHGGASAHQSPALSRRSGTRSLATCTRGWPSWSLHGLA